MYSEWGSHGLYLFCESRTISGLWGRSTIFIVIVLRSFPVRVVSPYLLPPESDPISFVLAIPTSPPVCTSTPRWTTPTQVGE